MPVHGQQSKPSPQPKGETEHESVPPHIPSRHAPTHSQVVGSPSQSLSPTAQSQRPARHARSGPHGVPSATGAVEQSPEAGSQTPALHAVPGQTRVDIGLPQTPPEQVSPPVHASPVSQGVPSGCGVSHVPVASLQLVGSHGSPVTAQRTPKPMPQWPLLQVSPSLHRIPSSQEVPSGS